MNGLTSVSKIKPIRRDKRDHLFITSSSFEERCRRVPELIDGVFCENSIIFSYEDVRKYSIGNENENYIYNILKDTTINEPDMLYCDFSDPYSVMFGLQQWIRDKKREEELEKSCISIDISCFTKLNLLLLLKYIGSKNKSGVIRFLYTQPLFYDPMLPEKKNLSSGIIKNLSVLYVQNPVRNGKEVLIIFLGMEGVRARAVWERIETEKTILIKGKPGFSREMEKVSEKKNIYLLDRAKHDPSFSPIEECSTINPWDTVYVLEERIVKKLQKEDESFHALSIAPLGTQLQTVGIYFFSQRVKEESIEIVYPLPEKYIVPYSVGTLNTFTIYWVSAFASLKWPFFDLGATGKFQRNKLYEEFLSNRY